MYRIRKKLYGVIAALFVVAAGLQSTYIIPFWQRNYSPQAGGLVAAQLSPEQILLQLFGFREFLAGILWVRADGFFDNGQYDAILPIIRICTVLDPHNIDIFAVGMWHIAYNFTDEDQRSDRRYIPIALALAKDGIKNNPDTYELYFETGWLWFQKIADDPAEAVKYFQEMTTKKDVLPAREDLLANAYFRNQQAQKGLDWYYKLYQEAIKRANESSFYSNSQIRDTIESNLDNTIIRMMQRGWLAEQRNDGSYETGDYDTKPPFNVGFTAKATVLRPRVIQFTGTWNVLPVGCRVRVIVRDANYPNAKAAELDWNKGEELNFDLPTNLTYMQDDLFVKDQRFQKTINMSKDPTMYPFDSDKYLIEFYYNPAFGPPHIQDKFGWGGKGMTDTRFLNTKIRPGIRCIYTTLTLSRDQILMRGAWQNRHSTIETAGYKDTSSSTSLDVVNVPNLRTEKK